MSDGTKTLFPEVGVVAVKMSDFEKQAVLALIQKLDNHGCKFTITDRDGEEHSNEPKSVKRTRMQSFKEYVTPILDALQEGDFVSVPFHIYTGNDLQSNISGRASNRWGKKSVTTFINKETQCVEVHRKFKEEENVGL